MKLLLSFFWWLCFFPFPGFVCLFVWEERLLWFLKKAYISFSRSHRENSNPRSSIPSSPPPPSKLWAVWQLHQMKFKERARKSQNTCWHFLNVFPLKTTDSTEQKPRARRQREELMFPMGSACYRSSKYKLGQGTSGAFTPAAPWRAAPVARLCDSYSPRIRSGVHSKQIMKLSPLEHFTTASSYLRGRHHLFQGSLHRAEYIF